MLRNVTRYLWRLFRFSDATGILGVLGVAIGVANIIALIGVTDTAQHQASGVMRSFGADLVFIHPYSGEGKSMMMRANASSFLPERYTGHIRESGCVDLVAGVLMMPGHAGRGEERVFTTVEGAEPGYPELRDHRPVRGRYINAEEEASNARVCVLGAALVEPLFGAEEPLQGEVVLKGERFTVIGVMGEKGFNGFESFDMRVFIPLSTAQELYDLPGTHTVLARAAPGTTPDRAKELLSDYLREAEGLKPDDPVEFEVVTVEDLTGVVDSMLSVFRFLMLGVSSVALIVAGIGIMNVMLMQVIGRTREIGIRRAVGARRRDIWFQFTYEALAQSLAGALIGMVLGIAGALGFCAFVDWAPHITAGTVLLAMGFGLGTGLIFGVYPAIYASRLKPIDCLRYE